MSDVLVVVIFDDAIQRDAGVLIGEPAGIARDESESPRLAGEIVFGDQAIAVRPAAAVVTSDRFEHQCSPTPRFSGVRMPGRAFQARPGGV
jgi:hypothetical protein